MSKMCCVVHLTTYKKKRKCELNSTLKKLIFKFSHLDIMWKCYNLGLNHDHQAISKIIYN